MKQKIAKIEGAMVETRNSRSQVRHLVADALTDAADALKNEVLGNLAAMFDGIEGYLAVVMNADLNSNAHTAV